MRHTPFISQLERAGTVPEIIDPVTAASEAPFSNVSDHEGFTALNAAYAILRKDGYSALADEPIEATYPEDSLRGMAVDAINSTTGEVVSQPRLRHETWGDDAIRLNPFECGDTAETQIAITTLFMNATSRARIFTDAQDMPVFLQAFMPFKDTVAVNLQPVLFRGLYVPEQTFVKLHTPEHPSAPGEGTIDVVNVEAVQTAVPIRASRFALNKRDRQEAFPTVSPTTGYDISHDEQTLTNAAIVANILASSKFQQGVRQQSAQRADSRR